MTHGEFREPIKINQAYYHENGGQVIDHCLVDGRTGEPITIVFGLDPTDMVRSIKASLPQRPVTLEEYVWMMESDDLTVDPRDPQTYQ